MKFIKEKITKIKDDLEKLIVLSNTPIKTCLKMDAGYKKKNKCPTVDMWWTEFNYGSHINKVDSHLWVYAKIRTPKQTTDHEKVYYALRTGREGQWDAYNPQCMLYIDGKAVQGLDVNHTDVELEFDREYELYLYLYTGMKEGEFVFEPSIKVIDTKIEHLYYDILVPLNSLASLDENGDDAVVTAKYLEMACNLIDLRRPYNGDFYRSVDSAIDFLKREYYENENVCGRDRAEVSCIGHTHIDVAWRWTIDQTEEKAQRSFATVLKLMDDGYDEYKFMSSQPQLYEYVKMYDPELYGRIKKRVAEGRFEPEGGMWLEADCNLSSGESLIRQIMFGKRFFKEEFGIDSKTLWLPDVFGYSSALPQILKKSGIDKFVTSKISWNDTNKLPYDLFMWEGLDGTEIFTSFITAQSYLNRHENMTTYVGDIVPGMAKGSRYRLQQKAYTDRAVITFGYGDGGGGPVRRMLEYHKRLKYGLPGIPKTVIETSTEYLTKLKADFDKGCKDLKKIPKWVGELYLEFHRGTYTSIAKNKKNNRKSEYDYQTLEQLSVATNRLLGNKYPTDEINSGWKTILLNQFHDIIPGSSIEPVYVESDKQYARIRGTAKQLMDKAYAAIAKGVDSSLGTVVYNPNSFISDGYVNVDGVLTLVKDIPAMGWRTVKNSEPSDSVVINGRRAENSLISIELDENANIVSIYDKENARQIVKPGEVANVIEAFEDRPGEYDNWEIRSYYKQKKWCINNVYSFETLNEGARAGFKIVRKFLDSVIIQKIYLYDGSRRIDFDTKIYWQEHHIMLKAAFPVDIHADKATYETQFGYLERNTHSNTPYDMAKFEVCAHKYADISEDDYGVAILNDCKYGHSTEGNVMKLTLLKSGTDPDPLADTGEHSFTYALYPHAGNHKQGKVVQEAYKLNRPLVSFKAEGDGSLKDSFSLVSCNKENVIIETVKKAENSDATVIRAYDAYNRRVTAEVSFGFDVSRAYLCDMLENKISELPVSDNKVTVDISTFEIVTIMVE